jgi:hypothetical protein
MAVAEKWLMKTSVDNFAISPVNLLFIVPVKGI